MVKQSHITVRHVLIEWTIIFESINNHFVISLLRYVPLMEKFKSKFQYLLHFCRCIQYSWNFLKNREFITIIIIIILIVQWKMM